MRVPDSICNAAIRASRMIGRHDPRGRRLGCDADSRFELVSVLDGYEGRMIYRFLCSSSVNSNDLEVWDSAGNAVDFVALDIAGQKASAGGYELKNVISVSIPRNIKTFWVGAKGESAIRIGALESKGMEIHRNCLMVNPGIDSLYPRWIAKNKMERVDACSDEALAFQPLFSIITPLYNTPVEYFNDMVRSVLSQHYQNWELILVNASPENKELSEAIEAIEDHRVAVIELDCNYGISENTIAGIKASSGDYIAFMDHDDVIEPELLLEYAKALNEDPYIDLLYCDEDSITQDGNKRFKPLFKFGFNLDLLLSHNYICHMLAVSRLAFDQVIPYDSSLDGAQDYDLTLKASRIARSIKHVPRILYHWRQHPGSTNGGSTSVKPYVVDASVKALSEYLAEDGIKAEVVPTEIPCVFEEIYPEFHKKDVSVVIVYENALQLAECLHFLSDELPNSVKEIVAVGPCVDLRSGLLSPLGVDVSDLDSSIGIEGYLNAIAGHKVKIVETNNEVSAFPANAGIKATKCEYILLLDADVRVARYTDAISRMRGYLVRDDVGVVSAKMLAMDELVYHAGLCIKDDGSVGYLNQGFIEGMGGGYHGCAECSCDYSAVDPSCIMFRRSDYDEVGGFSEGYEGQLAAGVDFSFRIRALGKKVVVAPQALVSIKPICGRWVLGESYIPDGSEDHSKLWDAWSEDFRTDVLDHPDIDLSSSYFRLKV